MLYSKIIFKERIFHLLAVSIGCLLTLGCSNSKITDTSAIISEEVTRLISGTKLSAVSVALVAEGSVDTYHYGVFADGSVPSDDTLYDIGSITKTHVGLILSQAVADGLIELDQPVSYYLKLVNRDALEYEGVEITIRHLATHISGLPTNLDCDDLEVSPKETLNCFMRHDDKDLLKRLTELELREKPGSNYRYSNSGIRIIGIVLENIYGEPLEQLLERFVFKRSGQFETFVKLSSAEHSRWRRGVHENGLPTPDASNYFNAAGGLKSTARDMGRYLGYYVQSGDEQAKRALTLLAGDRQGLGRAYVWNTFQLDSEGQYYHGGGTFGTSAWASLYPGEKLGIFLVTPFVSSTTQEQLNETANQIIERYRQKRE
jgi:serine-type D-Ala-D-Ala carboxypeptidase/endopeptidase